MVIVIMEDPIVELCGMNVICAEYMNAKSCNLRP